jgi:hypothetical protein
VRYACKFCNDAAGGVQNDRCENVFPDSVYQNKLVSEGVFGGVWEYFKGNLT